MTGLERGPDHRVDAVAEPVRRSVPRAGRGVSLGEHLSLLIVVETELVIGELVGQPPPERVQDIPVQVVLRPHLGADLARAGPQLGPLRVPNELDAHSIRTRNESEPSTLAPAAQARSASQRSEVTTRTSAGLGSARRRRTISSSAAFGFGLGACATSITVERIGGRGGRSNTTVTSSPLSAAHRSSRSTSRSMAASRSFHHASGLVPITFIPSTSQRT